MNETTWSEIVDVGWNILSGLSADRIRVAVDQFEKNSLPSLLNRAKLYGEVGSANRLVKSLGWI